MGAFKVLTPSSAFSQFPPPHFSVILVLLFFSSSFYGGSAGGRAHSSTCWDALLTNGAKRGGFGSVALLASDLGSLAPKLGYFGLKVGWFGSKKGIFGPGSGFFRPRNGEEEAWGAEKRFVLGGKGVKEGVRGAPQSEEGSSLMGSLINGGFLIGCLNGVGAWGAGGNRSHYRVMRPQSHPKMLLGGGVPLLTSAPPLILG